MKEFLKGFGCFLAVIMSVIFFIYLTLFTIVIVGDDFITKEGIKSYITDIDLINLPIGSLIGDNNSLEVDKDATIKNIARDALKNTDLSDELVADIINNKEIDNVTNDYLSDIIISNIYNKNLILNSDKLINAINNSKISNEDKLYIDSFFNDLTADLTNDESLFPEPFLKIINIINIKFFSLYLIFGFFLFAVIICLLRWCYYSFLNYMGIPTIVLGIILLLLFTFKQTIIMLLSLDSGLKDLVNTLLNPIYNDILLYGLLYIVIGIVWVIIHKFFQNRKQNKQNAKIINQIIEKAQ